MPYGGFLAECQRVAVFGPGRIHLHLSRRELFGGATSRRDHIDSGGFSRFPAGERDAATIRRPVRFDGLQGRIGKLHSLAAIGLASPESSIRVSNIRHGLSVARILHLSDWVLGKERHESTGLDVVAYKLGARLPALYK